jgi:beta-glucosidase
VPVAADPALLTDKLRDELGFTGTVVADYFAVTFLHSLHGVAADPGQAAALALAAGIDVELPTVAAYGEPLVAAVEAGAVDEALVDRALARVLAQKCELGLLDAGWSPEAPAAVDLDPPEARELAAELARRSIVLLANDGTLPLAPGRRVAVVGPRADDPHALLGCYAFPVHVGVHHPDVPDGVALPTVREALAGEWDVSYAPGGDVTSAEDAEIAAAVEAARDADVCVAVLGDRSGLFGRGTSGEGCDAADLRLPGRQEELLEALIATGTPVVLVLLVGRPYELSRVIDRLAAALCAFFPGEAGAAAVADVLAGRVNPGGKLPVHFPAAGEAQPATYLAPALGEQAPLFAFGHGLSYAPAEWVGVSGGGDWPTDGTVGVSVTLRNAAAIATSEVVQVYLHDPVAEVVRPRRQLIAAARVDLAPGEERTTSFTLHADLTSYTGRTARIVDPGAVELHVGASSADIRAVLTCEMTGPPRVVGADRVLA